MTDKKLKFGILCNSLTLQQWQATAISHLLQDPHFELSLIVINKTPFTKESLLKKVFSSTLLFRQYETRFLKVEAKQPTAIDSFKNIKTIEVITEQKGKYSQYFPKSDVEKVKTENLDFLIRFGFGILKGDILNAAKYGIWSYHHGDEKEFRGGPPGFWEIYKGKSTASCILQRLTPTLDGGIVLKKGTFKTTNHSYSYHLNTLFTHTAIWIKQIGLDILYNNKSIEHQPPAVADKYPINKAPKNFIFLNFLLLLGLNKIKFRLNSLFQVELWSIGFLQNTTQQLIEGDQLKVKWLEDSQPLSYRADPFITRVKNQLVIFFERYNYKKQKGHIASIEVKDNTIGEEKVVLKNENHYSYPFTFKQDETVLCLPECYMSKEIQVYTINDAETLVQQQSILPKTEIVDPSLLFYNNKYWLFCTINNYLHNAQLYIFYSDSLDGKFKPHLLNPVKTDISSARPAGSFIKIGNEILRPSQNCSETYGGSLMLNKIITLTETDYKEETIQEIKPFDKRYNKGLHHVCVEDNTIIIDGKKYIYSMRQAIRRLVR